MMQASFEDASHVLPSPTPKIYSHSRINKRVAATCLCISGIVGVFVFVLLMSGKFLLNGRVPMAPGANIGFGEYLLRSDQCTVGGADGTLVQRVFEPRDHLRDSLNAELLLVQMEALSKAGTDGKRRRLTPKLIQRGYLEWLVRIDEPPFNFTLGGARKMAIEVANRLNASCLCYAFLGIPENIVLLRTPPSAYEVMYEPTIVADSPKSTIVAYEEKYPLFSLIRNAFEVRASRTSEPWALPSMKVSTSFVTSSAGMVASITESAGIRRSMYDIIHYPCIKYCTSFFDDQPLPSQATTTKEL